LIMNGGFSPLEGKFSQCQLNDLSSITRRQFLDSVVSLLPAAWNLFFWGGCGRR
jgi:hypothetical protein